MYCHNCDKELDKVVEDISGVSIEYIWDEEEKKWVSMGIDWYGETILRCGKCYAELTNDETRWVLEKGKFEF
jgi:hypothetical protein